MQKKRAKSHGSAGLGLLGWREHIGLPDLHIPAIKVKVDTGAKTSALHASEIKYVRKKGELWVRFAVHPEQRSRETTIRCKARVKDKRVVISSVGHSTLRPVIETLIELDGERWPIEVTLVNRDMMGFRMLLGRQAIRNRYLVHPARSFLTDKRKKKLQDEAKENE